MDRTGSRIRARRLDAKIAQRDLAQSVGISASYLNLIEHDRRRIGGKLLTQLAAALGLDPALLAEGADAGLVGRMRAAASAADAETVEAAQTADLAARYPGWARLIAAQADQIAALQQRAQMLEDRITHDPALATALHGVISAVTSIQSTAAILTGDAKVDADWQARFHRNIFDDATRLAQTSAALIAYFDAPANAAPVSLSPLEEMEQALSQTGFYRPAQERGGTAGADDPQLSAGAAGLLADYDARYHADAVALPLATFLPAAKAASYDPLRVSAQMGRPLAQVMRRLAALPAQDDAPPLGLLICDAAGVVRLLKSVPGAGLSRAGLCPLWPIFTALGQPGRAVAAQAVLPGTPDVRLNCHAIADVIPHPDGPHMPPLIEATMLLRPDDGPAAAAAVPVGAGCRLCPRTKCPARREPASVSLAITL
ncbi:helix-turn-helix domain-containing protein [Loktanella salsilacus]|uniref:helix-turn-helix domain-containing protein n=1 Tax=Loktanella salsilacus TaxID=195913 RepID=UPI003703EC94